MPVQDSTIAQALLVMMRRGSFRATGEMTGYTHETISRYLTLAAQHAETPIQVLVHYLRLSTPEVYEFWPFIK